MTLVVKAQPSADAWAVAARLIARWLDRRARVDELFESAPKELKGPARARCQHLVFGVIRHFGRLEAEIGRLVSHPPRFETRAILFVAGFELIEAAADQGMVAKIVHHAVEQAKHLASPAEARLVNAVTRKLAAALETPPPPKLADAAALGLYFSHPEWLVQRWLVEFGAGPTRQLLEWNQQPAPVYARVRPSFAKPSEGRPGVPAIPDWLEPSQWPGWRIVPGGRWSEVEPLAAAGAIYIQDPGTRLAIDLLAPQRGEVILDACAAPGGKSLQISDRLAEGAPPGATAAAGRVIALDLPGPRIARLAENLSRARGADVALVPADLTHGVREVLKEHGMPPQYAAVLLDAPCTNTGVMRHRVDVKWRLQEGDFAKHAAQQGKLLRAAGRLVASGGRLVYSTCSIEREENENVVKAFVAESSGRFELVNSVTAYPWIANHDGASAFLLKSRS